MLIVLSTIVLLIISVGWKFRYVKKIHIPCMMTAFLIDVGLLLYIELSRHAIQTFQQELTSATPSGLLLFHIAVSLLMLILYIALIFTGSKLAKGGEQHRKLHALLANVFLLTRLTNYVTSMMIPSSI